MPDSNMSENSKYSLLLLGSVLLLVFVVLYIMQPLREDIQKNEQELTQAQQRLASYQTFAEQNKDYNAFAAKQEGYLAEAKKLLPDIVTVPELVQEYSNLSKECGIQFKSVKPPSGNLKQVNGAYEVPLNISISGNYWKMNTGAAGEKTGLNRVKERDAANMAAIDEAKKQSKRYIIRPLLFFCSRGLFMLYGITVEKTVKALLQPAIFLLFYMEKLYN